MKYKKEYKQLKAIKKVLSVQKELLDYLDSNNTDDTYFKAMKNLIIEKSFFAGGCFRCMFTNTKVKDYDIFFIDNLSAIMFEDNIERSILSLKRNVRINSEYSCYIKLPSGTMVNLITARGCKPDKLMQEFDVSFNQHYYYPFTGDKKFDKETFNKKGRVVYLKDKHLHLKMRRVLRWVSEGWEIEKESINELIATLAEDSTNTFDAVYEDLNYLDGIY